MPSLPWLGLLPHTKASASSLMIRRVFGQRMQTQLYRSYHDDQRTRLSGFWTPTTLSKPALSSDVSSHDLLLRAGYLRQAYSGVFHLLPLGLRVQDKLKRLIEKHMRKLGASKLSLSTISSETLWRKSGRLASAGSQLLRFQDRKKKAFLLSPTHEEEITALVASTCHSYKELPLRLYQITRKYRDEPRSREGLLRTREFVMKDLYTFDENLPAARETYDAVRKAYTGFFNDLKLPYLVAEADSGDMGGNLSHEYHYALSRGEDHVISCDSCSYVTNEELVEGVPKKPLEDNQLNGWTFRDTSQYLRELAPLFFSDKEKHDRQVAIKAREYISHDGGTLFVVVYPDGEELNIHALKSALPKFDPAPTSPKDVWLKKNKRALDPAAAEASEAQQRDSEIDSRPFEDEVIAKPTIVAVLDQQLPEKFTQWVSNRGDITLINLPSGPKNIAVPFSILTHHPETAAPLSLTRVKDGDECPRCHVGQLKVQKAVELGHTFLLGTRYSDPLEATVDSSVDVARGTRSQRVPLQMGCHGIGISRMIGAVAETLADEKGLNWPRVIAPFEVVVIPGKGNDDAAVDIYDALCGNRATAMGLGEAGPVLGSETPGLDVILDDRPKEMAWKLKDADLVGYPVVVILGRTWQIDGSVEVQCRRLLGAQSRTVPHAELPELVEKLLAQL